MKYAYLPLDESIKFSGGKKKRKFHLPLTTEQTPSTDEDHEV